RIDGPSRVEIAILLLRCTDIRNQAVHVRLELWIGMNAQSVGGAFDYFVDIGVVKWIAWRFLVCELFALQRCGRSNKIVQPSGTLALAERKRNGHLAIGFNFGSPERIVDVHRS